LGQASIAKSSRAFPNFGSAAAKQALGLINPNTYVYIYPSSELYIAFLTDSEHQFGQAASRACPAYIIYRYVYIYIYMYIYISIHPSSELYICPLHKGVPTRSTSWGKIQWPRPALPAPALARRRRSRRVSSSRGSYPSTALGRRALCP